MVEAKHPRSGETVSVASPIVIEPDDSIKWTTTCNLANGTDHSLLDYNLSWQPFFANNSDLQGITVHTLFSPMLFELNATNESISTASLFKLAPEQIMDGLSEVWFRLPVTDIPVNASIRTRIYRVLTATEFGMVFTGFGLITPTNPLLMSLVYDLTIDPKISNVTTSTSPPQAWEHYLRWQNVSVPGTNNTFYYNWTFLKACLGMFPNEWYLTVFDILAPYADGMKLAISTSDFGSDGKYNSWMWIAGFSYGYHIDLDTSFVATYGVSNGISGIGTSERTRAWSVGNLFHMNSSIPIGQTITVSQHYFNVIVPMFLNESYFATGGWGMFPTDVIEWVYFYTTPTDVTHFHWELLDFHITNSTYDFIAESVDLAAHAGTYIDHIRLVFEALGPNAGVSSPNSTLVKFWGTQNSVNMTRAGFTDIYWRGYEAPTYYWKMKERQYFIPFGYYGVDSWRWNMTNYSLQTVPINQPSTPKLIVEAIQQYEIWLVRENETGAIEKIGNFIWNTLWGLLDWTYGTFGKFMAGTIKWAYNHIPGLKEFTQWYTHLMSDVFVFFKGIGIWLWDIINFVFDALEWFTYWAVRIIYSLSIAIVYMVNVFGVLSMNSALFSVIKTGNGKDFVKAFKAGWKVVLAIITLLLSLAIMAISIVGAVVPF